MTYLAKGMDEPFKILVGISLTNMEEVRLGMEKSKVVGGPVVCGIDTKRDNGDIAFRESKRSYELVSGIV